MKKFFSEKTDMSLSFLNFIRVANSEEFNTRKAIASMCQLYCRIWAEEPWNEPDWKETVVKKDFLDQLKKRGAIAFLATQIENSTTIGFSWGYKVSPDDLEKISGNKKFYDILENKGPAFYIDELGVEKEHRKNGIGYMLSNLIIESAKEEGSRVITLRTDQKAIPAKKLYQNIGFEELSIVDTIYNNRTYWLKTI